jgi:hypothetical protein
MIMHKPVRGMQCILTNFTFNLNQAEILMWAAILDLGTQCFRINGWIHQQASPLQSLVLPVMAWIVFRCKVALMEQLKYIRVKEPIEAICQCQRTDPLYHMHIFTDLVLLMVSIL